MFHPVECFVDRKINRYLRLVVVLCRMVFHLCLFNTITLLSHISCLCLEKYGTKTVLWRSYKPSYRLRSKVHHVTIDFPSHTGTTLNVTFIQCLLSLFLSLIDDTDFSSTWLLLSHRQVQPEIRTELGVESVCTSLVCVVSVGGHWTEGGRRSGRGDEGENEIEDRNTSGNLKGVYDDTEVR